MQKSTFNILFYVKRNAVKANGKMPIMGRITVNGEAVQFGAKTEVNPKIWDTKSGKAVGKTQDVIDVNGILESIKATLPPPRGAIGELSLSIGELTLYIFTS